jgi:hypothetical protein
VDADALLYKNGIVKVWWDTRVEETKEEYKGLTKVELAQIMDDEEVEVTEQRSYPDEEDAKARQQAIEQQPCSGPTGAAEPAGHAVQQISSRSQQIQQPSRL